MKRLIITVLFIASFGAWSQDSIAKYQSNMSNDPELFQTARTPSGDTLWMTRCSMSKLIESVWDETPDEKPVIIYTSKEAVLEMRKRHGQR